MAGVSLTVSGLHRTLGPEPRWYVEVARVAEQAGVTQLLLPDHVVLGERLDRYPYGTFPGGQEDPWLEPLTMLAAIAAATSCIRIGTGVLIAPLRPAALLAKQVATLDDLSGGRVDLGVGVGWQPEEYEAVGLDFADRWNLLDSTLRTCRTLWESDGGPIWCRPRPAQGRLPVWFGAAATPALARRVAEVGDGWLPMANLPPDQVSAGIARLKEAMADAGRDPAGLRVRAGLPREAADIETLLGTGVTLFSVGLGRDLRTLPDIQAHLGRVMGRAAGWSSRPARS